MDMLVYRLNMCISKDDHKSRIEVLEEIINIAQCKLRWEREYLREKEVAKTLEGMETFSK